VKKKNKKIEPTSVGSARCSSRSRLGQIEQDKMTASISELLKNLGSKIQLEVEPNVNTFNNIINKKDKKKLN
tara:strand:+ start:243 stop:458 length:216 start_codon:yes stop_codon:yes gene_type:complete